MVEWHNEGLTPDDIQKIIREGRDKEDNTTFNDYGDYIKYIYKDNERILNEYFDHDHTQCEPNDETKAAMEEARDFEINKNATIDFQQILEELHKDREERSDYLASIIIESMEKNKPILDALGSDFDENGIPYWEKWKDGGRKESDGNIN